MVGWLRRARLWARRRPPLTPESPQGDEQAPELHGRIADSSTSLSCLTTPQLCALWRKSSAGLRAASTPAAVAEVVDARGVLLDELERREPDAMTEWLEAGALEPEGPSVYLVR